MPQELFGEACHKIPLERRMAKTQKEYDYDIHNLERRFSFFDDRINESELLPENKQLAKTFKNKVFAAGLMREHRILKYESFFKTYDSLLKKPFDQATREDLEAVVSHIRARADWKELTKRDFLLLLKRYHKIACGLEDEQEYPAIVKWIKTPKVKEQPIKWDEVPTWEDICKMADCTLNQRDRAAVKSIWEAGHRIGEHLTLRIGDIEETETGLYFNVWESKTEPRKVYVKLSKDDIMSWLEMHPLKHDKNAPLFCGLKVGTYHKAMSHRYMYTLLKKLKERAKIDKKIYPHMLRHGSASYFSDWLSDSDMDTKYGWRIGSKMKARYTHKNPKSVQAKIDKMAGEEENGAKNIYEEMREDMVKCLRCDKLNSPNRKTCWYCKAILCREYGTEVELIKKSLDAKIEKMIEEQLKTGRSGK